jgi:hypothetical protein
MACLHVTTEQLEEEFVAVFGDGVSVPVKLWVDHYHDYHTFIRVVFKRFNGKGADKLQDFRDRLMERYGFKQAELSVVVFLDDNDWTFFAAHRLQIHLAG